MVVWEGRKNQMFYKSEIYVDTNIIIISEHEGEGGKEKRVRGMKLEEDLHACMIFCLRLSNYRKLRGDIDRSTFMHARTLLSPLENISPLYSDSTVQSRSIAAENPSVLRKLCTLRPGRKTNNIPLPSHITILIVQKRTIVLWMSVTVAASPRSPRDAVPSPSDSVVPKPRIRA